MHAEVREVQEEGMRAVPLHEVDREVGEEVGEVGALRDRDLGVRREGEVPALGHDGLREAVIARVVPGAVAQVPLAEQSGRVARRRELVGEGGHAIGEAGAILGNGHRPPVGRAALERTDGVHAGARGTLPAHQGGAGRRAVLAMVVMQESHPLRGQRVDVRGLVVARAHAPEVGPTKIIRQDEDDVGRGGRHRRVPGRRRGQDEAEGEHAATIRVGLRRGASTTARA